MLRIIFCLFLLSFAKLCHAVVWPFDQRQVLLVQAEGTKFPDDLTVAQIMDVFVERGRVRWMTEKSGDSQVKPLWVPKDFLWDRPSSVRSLGMKHGADGIVLLSETDSRIDLRWYGIVDGQPLYYESLYLPSSSGTSSQDEERKKRLKDWLSEMWNRIPGQGFVAKRDIETLQLEGLANVGIKAGDQVELLRLKNVVRHPVLKTLMKFEYSETGLAQVTTVSKPFSIAHVIYESKLDAIQVGDRYLLKKVAEEVVDVKLKEEGTLEEAKDEASNENADGFFASQFFVLTPRIGVGSLSYEERTENNLFTMQSLSLSYGFRAELLLTSKWYTSLQMDMGTGKFSSLPDEYEASSMASGWSKTRIETGYRISMGEGLGVATVSGGYSRFKFKAEALGSDVAPSAKLYSGLDLGLLLSLPVWGVWSAEAGFTRVLGTFMKEDSLTSGETSSDSTWSFVVQTKVKTDENMEFGLGYEVSQAASTFEGVGTRNVNAISSKATSQRLHLFYGFIF